MNKRETNEPDSCSAPSELASIWSRVQTARLTLRRLQPTDGPAMFAVHGDPATYRYSPEVSELRIQSGDGRNVSPLLLQKGGKMGSVSPPFAQFGRAFPHFA